MKATAVRALAALFIFLVLESQHTDSVMGACVIPNSPCHTNLNLA